MQNMVVLKDKICTGIKKKCINIILALGVAGAVLGKSSGNGCAGREWTNFSPLCTTLLFYVLCQQTLGWFV